MDFLTKINWFCNIKAPKCMHREVYKCLCCWEANHVEEANWTDGHVRGNIYHAVVLL